MHSPLIPIVLVYSLGVYFGFLSSIPPAVSFLAGVIAACASILLRKRTNAFQISVLILWVCVGILRYCVYTYLSDSDIASLVKNNPPEMAIMGRVADDPSESFSPEEPFKQICVLKVSHARLSKEWRRASGLIRLQLQGHVHKLSYADEVLVEGRWMEISPPSNPGQYDWRFAMARQGIHVLLLVKPYQVPVVLKKGTGSLALKLVIWLRHKIEDLIDRNFDSQHAGLLRSLLLGQRVMIGDDLKRSFVETGTMHLLVISGFNVGLIALILELFLRVFFLPFRVRLFLISVGLAVYCMLTGMQPPVNRATIMAWIVLGGLAIDRNINWANSLAFAGLVIMLVNPMQLFDPSFQLSFGAVASLIVFTTPISSFIESKLFFLPGKINKYVALSLASTITVWVGIWPFLAWYFHLISPVSVLANLFLVPMVSALVVGGSILFGIGMIFEPVIRLFQGVISFWLEAILFFVRTFHGFKFGFYPVPHPSIAIIALYYFLLLVSFLRKWLKLSFGKIVLLWVLGLNIWLWGTVFHGFIQSRFLEVRFLDVGHGDSIFIRTPEGHNLLIDSGSKEAGQYCVVPFLRYKGVSSLDALILTHADEDHIGGAQALLSQIKVKNLFANGLWVNTETADDVLGLAKRNKAVSENIYSGVELTIGSGTYIMVLHPPFGGVSERSVSSNINSLVLKLVNGDRSFLFCGDVGNAGFELLFGWKERLRSDVLGIPHHGSNWGDYGERLIDLVRPKVAVISVGRLHNLPNENVIKDLNKANVIVAMTIDDGSLLFKTDGKMLTARAFRSKNNFDFAFDPISGFEKQ